MNYGARILIFSALFLVADLWSLSRTQNKGPKTHHPGFDLVFLGSVPRGVGALDWVDPERTVLAITEWGGRDSETGGKLHMIYGINEAENSDDVVIEEVATGLHQPLGMENVDGVLYVHEKADLDANNSGSHITKFTGSGNDWTRESHCKGWGEQSGFYWHSWPSGLEYIDGSFYLNFSSRLGQSKPATDERGVAFKIDAETCEYEIFSSGMRTNESTFQGPWGELFTSDNQGEWQPADKLINLREGRYYGHYGYAPEQPPASYLSHMWAGESPTSGVYLKKGLYKGHLLVGEHDYEGINRHFIEEINGELQTALFDFSGGLNSNQDMPNEPGTYNDNFQNAHPHRMTLGPDDETIIFGACGSDVWVAGPIYGAMGKLVPNGNIGYEMLAIRNLGPTQFEVEFTKPVNVAAATNTGNWDVFHFTRTPVPNYGGGAKENQEDLTITSATIVENTNNTRVLLTFPANTLTTGTVERVGDHLEGVGYTVGFNVENIPSADGDDAFDPEAYYTLNQFGPADRHPVPGCTDPLDAAYDPLANDNFGCSGNTISIEVKGQSFAPEVTFDNSRLVVSPTLAGNYYTVSIHDTRGKLIHGKSVRGVFEYSGFENPGTYMVTVEANGNKSSKKIVVF